MKFRKTNTMVKTVVAVALGVGILGSLAAGIKGCNKEAQALTPAPAEKVEFVKGTFTSTEKSPSGNDIIELTDGSFIYHDIKSDTWGFQPAEMGDWDIDGLDSNQAQEIAEEYMKNKNALAENQRKNVEVRESYQVGEGSVTIFTDGSYVIAEPTKNAYSFYPVELGDWGYHSSYNIDADKQVRSYLTIKNTGGYEK